MFAKLSTRLSVVKRVSVFFKNESWKAERDRKVKKRASIERERERESVSEREMKVPCTLH